MPLRAEAQSCRNPFCRRLQALTFVRNIVCFNHNALAEGNTDCSQVPKFQSHASSSHEVFRCCRWISSLGKATNTPRFEACRRWDGKAPHPTCSHCGGLHAPTRRGEGQCNPCNVTQCF